MHTTLRQLLFGLTAAVCASLGLAATAMAESPQGMKMYVFSSGALTLDKALLQSNATGTIKVPVAFFLIHHPKGNVLFDTGNNDRIITDKSYWGPNAAMLTADSVTPDVGTMTQLEKAGFKASDINYVVLGHMHLDHAGNAARFPTATLVYQRDEIINALWPKPGYAGPYIPGDILPLRSDVGSPMPNKQKVMELNGDIDLFGDGSIYVKRQVGHTPGSEMMVVRLPKTGVVILTSDECYLLDNLKQNILPSVGLAYDPSGMLQGYEWIKQRMDAESADVIFAHDPEVYKQHKHAPDYYE
jgi:glyoxylase-like metal-dependent hydrolase (beta-lactamase superfamily II)